MKTHQIGNRTFYIVPDEQGETFSVSEAGGTRRAIISPYQGFFVITCGEKTHQTDSAQTALDVACISLVVERDLEELKRAINYRKSVDELREFYNGLSDPPSE